MCVFHFNASSQSHFEFNLYSRHYHPAIPPRCILRNGHERTTILTTPTYPRPDRRNGVLGHPSEESAGDDEGCACCVGESAELRRRRRERASPTTPRTIRARRTVHVITARCSQGQKEHERGREKRPRMQTTLSPRCRNKRTSCFRRSPKSGWAYSVKPARFGRKARKRWPRCMKSTPPPRVGEEGLIGEQSGCRR
jgi:hypothetical protein